MKKKESTQEETQKKFFRNIIRFKNYLELSYVELKKVTWPTFKETKTTSLIVLIFVSIMSIFLGLVDLGLSKTIAYILKF